MKKVITAFVLAFSFFFVNESFANEIIVNTGNGETFVFDVDPDEKLSDLEEKITALTNGKRQTYLIELPNSSDNKVWDLQCSGNPGGYIGCPRNYHEEVTPAERADIHYIVTSLANNSLISLGFAKEELEAAGDRIVHLHPLRFLMVVFTNEELKVGIRNIRGRGWVWNQFVGGLKEALATERQIDNLKDEYVQHFAQTVEIAPHIIHPHINTENWDEFIDTLITQIPRKGDHDRFDT